MHNYPEPHFIDFGKLGESLIGYISVAQNNQLPFPIQRAFWTYYTPESIVRGRHAHYATEQILIAVAGKIIVNTETAGSEISTFILESPEKGLYIPPHVWHTMQYSHSAVQLVFASGPYDEKDYIRDMNTFRTHWKK